MSYNRAYRGRVYPSAEYKQYIHDVSYLLPKLVVPEGKLKLEITFGFSNKSSDIDNGVKAFLDLLQKKYNFNDKMVYEMHIYKDIVKKGLEYIDFSLKSYPHI